MSDQNPTTPIPDVPVCGSNNCLACAEVRAEQVSLAAASINGPNARLVADGQMTVNRLIFGPIAGGQITSATLRAGAVEPPLTVKQAAKAYRKAVRAHEEAVKAHRDAQTAERDARAALARASNAREEAQTALEKAATQ